jgi:hypothetical protein
MFYCAAPPAVIAMHQTKETISQRLRNLGGMPDNTRDIDRGKLSFEGAITVTVTSSIMWLGY